MKFIIFFILASISLVQARHNGTVGIFKMPMQSARLSKRGDLTFYNPGNPGSPGMSACEIPITDNDFIAALSFPDFGNQNPPRSSPRCGQCIRVYVESKSVAVTVVDKCEGCKPGDVDLSPVAYNMIADPVLGRVNSNWEVVSSDQCSRSSSLPVAPPPQNTMVSSTPSAIPNPTPVAYVGQPSTPTYVPSSSTPNQSTVQPVNNQNTVSTTNPLSQSNLLSKTTGFMSSSANLVISSYLFTFVAFFSFVYTLF